MVWRPDGQILGRVPYYFKYIFLQTFIGDTYFFKYLWRRYGRAGGQFLFMSGIIFYSFITIFADIYLRHRRLLYTSLAKSYGDAVLYLHAIIMGGRRLSMFGHHVDITL